MHQLLVQGVFRVGVEDVGLFQFEFWGLTSFEFLGLGCRALGLMATAVIASGC